MRVTVDYDSRNIFRLLLCISKGIFLLKKTPELWKTRKGFHLIWRGLPLSSYESLKLRYIIGDDRNRIELDKSTKRITQILFTSKSMHKYVRKGNHYSKIIIQKRFSPKRLI
jgi:hypothetical protein